MNARQIYLLVCAGGIVPIALYNGLFPQSSLGFLFGLELPDPDGVHLFRAVMGLYLALAVFWVAGYLRAGLRQPAIWSAVVFMAGLAAGRILSLLVDGPAHWLLNVYLALELVFGIAGAVLLTRPD
jgi:hypothetical protein